MCTSHVLPLSSVFPKGGLTGKTDCPVKSAEKNPLRCKIGKQSSFEVLLRPTVLSNGSHSCLPIRSTEIRILKNVLIPRPPTQTKLKSLIYQYRPFPGEKQS